MNDETPNPKKPKMPKDSIEVQAMFAALVSQYGDIEALKRKLKSERAQTRDLKSRVNSLERYFTQGGVDVQCSEIPEDMMSMMIRLCHPDRHGNNESSNKVTTWLLAQRKQHRSA